MPATPTARQISFYNTLAAERGLPTIDAFAPGTSGRDASAAIDRLLAMPRPAGATAARRNDDAEQLAGPSLNNRAGRMLAAGGFEATVTMADGRHVTVTVRTRKRSGRGWTNAALGEQDSRTNLSVLGQRVGWITVNEDGTLNLTLRTRNEQVGAAIRDALAYAAGQAHTNRVQEASRCGRCFRTLTDPVSIDRGIGPECFGRDTGSQHVAAWREASGAAVVRERMPRTVASRTEMEEGEARMHAAFAAAEQAQERAAYEREMAEERAQIAAEELELPRREAPSLVELAQRVEAPRTTERPADRNVAKARELIAEALDAYCAEADMRFAMNVFDQLAAR